jgi:hypothetical protein
MTTSPRRRALALAVATTGLSGVVVACGSEGACAAEALAPMRCIEPTHAVDPGLAGSTGEQDLAAAIDRWQRAGAYDYAYVQSELCGERAGIGTARVEVVDGRVKEVDPLRHMPLQRAYALTVPELFDQIEEALQRGEGTTKVTYDAELGYPRDVRFDPMPEAVDDERCVHLDQLELTEQGVG